MLLQAIQTQIALAADMEAIVRRVNGSPKYKSRLRRCKAGWMRQKGDQALQRPV